MGDDRGRWRRRLVVVALLIALGGAATAWYADHRALVAEADQVRAELEAVGAELAEAVRQGKIQDEVEDAPDGARVTHVVSGGVDFGPPPQLPEVAPLALGDPGVSPPADPGLVAPHRCAPCPPAFHQLRPDDLAGNCRVEHFKDPAGRSYARAWWSGRARQYPAAGELEPVVTERGPVKLEDLDLNLVAKAETRHPWWFDVTAGVVSSGDLVARFDLVTHRWTAWAVIQTADRYELDPGGWSYNETWTPPSLVEQKGLASAAGARWTLAGRRWGPFGEIQRRVDGDVTVAMGLTWRALGRWRP